MPVGERTSESSLDSDTQKSEQTSTAPSSQTDSNTSIHQQLTDESKSALKRYQELTIGDYDLWSLIKFELIMLLCSGMPGALGLLLRKIFYPKLLKSVGRNVVFGRNVSLRHGKKIRLGDNVVVDDNVLLDAKGSDNNGLEIGDNTIVSRNCTLACKEGDIHIGGNGTIGINSLVHAVKGSNVFIGDDVLIGAFAYFVGGGNYHHQALDIPFKKQGSISKGGIVVENNVWIGSHVQFLDGVRVGTGCIIGASAVVNKDIPAYTIAAGVPVRIVKQRQTNA